MGRRKIQMKKIEDQMARQVCFSKRKQGLFKKACELSMLCGAEVAIILFSPSGHPFVYAQPSLPAVAKTCFSFLRPTTTTTTSNNNNPKQSTQDFLKEHAELLPLLEAARATLLELKSVVAAETAAASTLGALWQSPIEDLSLSELETLWASAELAKERMAIEAEMAAAAPPPMGDDLAYRLHYFDGDGEW
ncbi:Agamous-like MADS-box protein AGL62 [Acorus gramineus]|uniref:Agamous-like MADS-box protein AGL62 n=1 Tax=Acorus gramineus TaxID=55184 RepID=A0AAV9AQX9_ACOGR|nr:Agamous-like MADS-box protein AGL62 [Acorus gramineus]